MVLIDVHAHLDHAQFDKDLDKVLERARAANVVRILTNGVNPETNRKSIALAKKYDIISAALGIYPVEALAKEAKQAIYPLKIKKFDVDKEVAWMLKEGKKKASKVVAIGEVGMDNHTIPGSLKKQVQVFEKMIGVAEKLKKPIIVHSRKAEKDCIDLLQSSSLNPGKIVMHCFSGSLKLAEKAAEYGMCFSIPTNIVFSTHFQELIKRVNINQLFTETDAPYLSPVKGERNESANITHSIKKIAEIKGFTVEETENNLLLNYKNVFG
jgi:TatD DNase family protein